MFRSRARDQMEVAGKIAVVTPVERVQNHTVYAYSCAGDRTPKALWFFMIFGFPHRRHACPDQSSLDG